MTLVNVATGVIDVGGPANAIPNKVCTSIVQWLIDNGYSPHFPDKVGAVAGQWKFANVDLTGTKNVTVTADASAVCYAPVSTSPGIFVTKGDTEWFTLRGGTWRGHQFGGSLFHGLCQSGNTGLRRLLFENVQVNAFSGPVWNLSGLMFARWHDVFCTALKAEAVKYSGHPDWAGGNKELANQVAEFSHFEVRGNYFTGPMFDLRSIPNHVLFNRCDFENNYGAAVRKGPGRGFTMRDCFFERNNKVKESNQRYVLRFENTLNASLIDCDFNYHLNRTLHMLDVRDGAIVHMIRGSAVPHAVRAVLGEVQPGSTLRVDSTVIQTTNQDKSYQDLIGSGSSAVGLESVYRKMAASDEDDED